MKNGIAFVFGEILLVLLIVWASCLWFASDDRKPMVACAPLYYTVGVGDRASMAAGQGVGHERGVDHRTFAQRATLVCLKAVDAYVRAK